MIKNVFDTIFSMDNLYLALEDASRTRRYKKDVLQFNDDAGRLLDELRTEIYQGTYRIDKYHVFYVYEPKKRMIMSIAFRHRVVQWAIYRVLNPLFTKGYITDSYGCIDGRGAVGAMKRLKYWVDQANRKSGTWYYLKLDISKYFYRISHRVLKKILRKKIDDDRLLYLLFGIIDCENRAFGLPRGKSPGDVRPEEMLFDVGMPIGNLMSQTFANLYLDALDQYCKRVLGIDKYIRYMDDVIILGDSKEKLWAWRNSIDQFLLSELELDLNKKTCIRPISQGIEFVGYRIWPTHVVLRKRTTLHIKRSLKKVQKQYHDYEITMEDAFASLQSYLGMFCHCDSHSLQEKILEEFVLTHGDRISPEEEIWITS
jgi:retron-type reverse transcriptase